MREKVTFNMATMPPRIPALADSIPSIINQCDVLNIYLNDFEDDEIPAILRHPKIKLFRSQHEIGNLGDVGKFYFCNTWTEGYVFTVDDKIIYPRNYVAEHIAAIERYGRKAVVSCHGRLLKSPCRSYYHDPAAFYGVLGTIITDTFAHELGTGAMAFHVDTVKASMDDFPYINMTDIYFSMKLQRKGIPILIRKHFRGDFRLSTKHDEHHSIHNTFNKDDSFQTEVVNGFEWKINRC